VVPYTSMPLLLVVEVRANLTALKLVAFVEAVDSLRGKISHSSFPLATMKTYIECAHDRFELDVYDAILVGFVNLDLLDGTELHLLIKKKKKKRASLPVKQECVPCRQTPRPFPA
jgi:hypothetical protein